MRKNSAVLAVLTLVGGCALTPPYHPPSTLLVADFKEAGGWESATPLDDTPRGAWWSRFGDPQLDALERALETQSPSLAAAAARKAQADALLAQARAARSPVLAANADTSRTRLSATRPLSQGTSATYSSEDIGGSISYEVDLWGRVRNSIAAGRATAQASAADLMAVRLALEAQLAESYFALRGIDDDVALLERSISAYQRAYDLTRVRHQGGIASGLDESRALTVLDNAKAQLDAARAARAITEHELGVLTGQLPSAFNVAPTSQTITPPVIVAVAPSQLLQRRPDVAAAERRMFAANAQIGIARAAFYPSLTLGGSAGYLTTGSNLLSAPNAFWALGPASALVNLFDGGKRRAVTQQARAAFDEAAATYRSTVIGAFQDVEDALAKLHHLQDEVRHQDEAAQSAQTTLDLAFIRYHDGAASYLDVVTAQTAALDAARAALALHTQRLQAHVALIRAFGGDYSSGDSR